jgi:hypothetical protein
MGNGMMRGLSGPVRPRRGPITAALAAFQYGGHLKICHDIAESGMRPYLIGRNDDLLSGTPKHPDVRASFHSLAIMSGLGLTGYLNHLFRHILHAKSNTLSSWSCLTS